jgi:hypothetical protein
MRPVKNKKLTLEKTTIRNLDANEARRVRAAGGPVLCLDRDSSGTTIIYSGGNTCVSCYQDSNCYC